MDRLSKLKYRIKLRQQFTKAPIELLELTKDELKREYERRNKKRN